MRVSSASYTVTEAENATPTVVLPVVKLLGSPRVASRRLITGIASSSHTVEYTGFGEAVRSLANFHVKQKAATSLSSINSSQRKLSARGSCRAMLSTNPIAIATRPQGVNIISKVVNPSNGCYAQYIRGSILSLPLYILLLLLVLLWCYPLLTSSDKRLDMIECDKCDKWYRLNCAGLTTIPEGDWYCVRYS